MNQEQIRYCECPNQEWLTPNDICPCCGASVRPSGFQADPIRESFDPDYFEALEALLKALDQAA